MFSTESLILHSKPKALRTDKEAKILRKINVKQVIKKKIQDEEKERENVRKRREERRKKIEMELKNRSDNQNRNHIMQ